MSTALFVRKVYRVGTDEYCSFIVAENPYYAKKKYIEGIMCEPYFRITDFKDYGIICKHLKQFDAHIREKDTFQIDPYCDKYWQDIFYARGWAMYDASEGIEKIDRELVDSKYMFDHENIFYSPLLTLTKDI